MSSTRQVLRLEIRPVITSIAEACKSLDCNLSRVSATISLLGIQG